MKLENYIGKKILWKYSDHDKRLMKLPLDYTEIFIGEAIEEEDGVLLLWDNEGRYVTLEYAKENLIS
jgi:hypothetical protein